MAAASSKSNPPRTRKRVEVETSSLKRARDGSAFTRCEECSKDVPVGLIDMHSCSLDSKIKMNLDSQIVETVTEVRKPAERKKAVSSEPKAKKGRKEKKEKDPNMPKRPPTAFFLFMDDFRKEFKETHPDSKRASTVAKEGGEKWKSMTDEEKKPYLEKVLELKAKYGKAVENANAECEEVLEISDKE
ncbi:hypothetical protein AAC387_Pa01g0452 [Persea americana]